MTETTTDAGHTGQEASRRAVLAGAAGVGAAAALAACGNDKPSAGGTNNGNTGGNASAGIKKSDIPEGGGKIYGDTRVVVTQPNAGTYKAFDAVCTHQGCIVADVSGGTINCTCHGSRFSIADGSVKEAANGDKTNAAGQKGLAERTVTVDGDNLKVS